jgi:hypothetical protein
MVVQAFRSAARTKRPARAFPGRAKSIAGSTEVIPSPGAKRPKTASVVRSMSP